MERSKERKKGVRQEEEKERRERMGETEEISTEAVHSPGLFCKNVEKLCLSQKWQPTPVFLPGESQGCWSLVGWRLWGRTESDTTEVT